MTPVTDAASFPDTVTVTFTYHWTSPDGKTTKTGTATFNYSRAYVRDLLARPGLLFDLASLPTPENGKFIAVQSALGKVPGWIVSFGAQPPQASAYTVVYTDAGGHTTTTYQDADSYLSMSCTACAPGRRVVVDPEVDNTWLALVSGINSHGDHVAHAGFTVEQIYAGAAATQTTAEIGPVYRVTIPGDAGELEDQQISVVLNGTMTPLSVGDRSSGVRFVGADALIEALGQIGETGSRTPWVCEVALPHFGDTLAAGSVSYFKLVGPVDSLLYATPGGTAAIADPFHLGGQTLTVTDADDGLVVTVAF